MSTEDLYVGCISGTSLDGLDVAVMRFRDEAYPDMLAACTYPFPPALHAELMRLTFAGENEIYRVGQAHVTLGRFIGDKVLLLLASEGIPYDDVRAIGSHGQTVRHHPEAQPAFTLQIGDPNVIVETTGIAAVSDFRSRDVAAGGEGAPLACAYHRYLFGHPRQDRAIVNLGGIANVTLLHAEADRVTGFDTGPANVLLDAWCRSRLNEPTDHWGKISAQGTPIVKLLSLCLQDAYFARSPPKSTGREYFNLGWLEAKMLQAKIAQDADAKDVLATLARLTAETVAAALQPTEDFKPELVWVGGGGRRNGTVLARLAELCPSSRVESIEQSGMNGDFIEAAAFAWLARERLAGRPGNIPEITGAAGRRVLGSLYSV